LKINEPEGSQRPPRRERQVDTADVSVDDLKI